MVTAAPYKKVHKHNLSPICRGCKSVYIRECNAVKFFRHVYADGSWWQYLYDGLVEGDMEVITIEGGPGQYVPVWINTQTNMAEWNM